MEMPETKTLKGKDLITIGIFSYVCKGTEVWCGIDYGIGHRTALLCYRIVYCYFTDNICKCVSSGRTGKGNWA